MEGRFVQKDPISFAGGDVNLYAMVHNNTINHKDPYGLSDCPCGTWYGYGVDAGVHVLYGGSISIMKFVCSSNPNKTCTAISACVTGGVDADVGINATGCRVQNTPNFGDFPSNYIYGCSSRR